MTLPITYFSTLLAAIAGLLLLGSWINTLKLAKKWRFELYYFDFAIGAALAAAVAAATLGTWGSDGFTFMDDLMRAGKRNMAFAVAAGSVFNLGNMFLVGATTLVGMSVAFPLAMGLALLISSILAYLSKHEGNPTMFYAGLALVAAAAVFSIMSHRVNSLAREIARMKAGEHRTLRPSIPWKGIILCVASGVLLSVFLPLLNMAKSGETGVGPYSVAFLFGGGILFSTVVYNLYFMNLPIAGQPIEIFDYVRGQMRKHALGVLGGIGWAAGWLCWLVVCSAPEEALTDRALVFAIVQSAPVLAALWGILVWKEIELADARGKAFAFMTLFLLLAGLVMLRLAGFSAAV